MTIFLRFSGLQYKSCFSTCNVVQSATSTLMSVAELSFRSHLEAPQVIASNFLINWNRSFLEGTSIIFRLVMFMI